MNGTVRNYSSKDLWVVEYTSEMPTARLLRPGEQSPPGAQLMGIRPRERNLTINGKDGFASLGSFILGVAFRDHLDTVNDYIADVLDLRGQLACIGTCVGSVSSFGIVAH